MSNRFLIAWLLAASVLTGGTARAQDSGYVRQWLLAGPLTNPKPETLLDAPILGDPAKLAPQAGDAAGKGKWAKYAAPGDTVDLKARGVPVKAPRNCAAAAFIYVHCPKMISAKMLMGVSEGLAVYVNGHRAYVNRRNKRLAVDAFRADVLLGAGWNRLYLKITRHENPRRQWGFSLRFVGADLKPIRGLKFSTDNPFDGGAVKMPAYTPHVNVYAVEHFGTHRIRLANHTPIDLADVELTVIGRGGRKLMTKALGTLKGHAHVEAEVDVDEVFFQQHYRNATAVIAYKGGKLQAPITTLALPGTHRVEFETPHVNRMKPWAAGRPAVLLLTRGVTRQAMELVQRGDLEWHWVDTADSLAGSRIAEELTLHKFDCIVVAAQKWGNIPNAALLGKAIAGGVGVVVVNPTGLDEAMGRVLGLDPAAAPKPGRAGKVEQALDHPVISGLPLAALPPLGPYEQKTAGDAVVVAKVGALPAIIVNQAGRTRAVTLNLGRGAQLIWPMRRDQILQPRLPAWERQWSLVLKAVVWAARKDGLTSMTASAPARIAREGLGDARLKVTMALPSMLIKPIGKSKIVATFRDSGLTGPKAETKEFLLRGGKQEFELPIPAGLSAGEIEADAVLTTAGKVAGWASAVFTIAPRGSIDARKLAAAPKKDCYAPSDKITFTVPGRADADGLTLTARLADNRGRVVWQQSRQVKKGAFTETFSVACDGLLTPVARFQAELAAPTHAEAQAEHIFFVRQELVWDSYEPVLWLTRHSINWHYDVDYFRLVRVNMWIPNGWSSHYSPTASAYQQMVYGGFNRVGFESLHFFSMNHNWTKATFEHRRVMYNRTKDKRWLYRTPIDKTTKAPVDQPDYENLRFNNDPHNSFFPLSDPGYLDWTQRKIAWQLQRVKLFNPIVYDLMDEGSYTSYARALDFDYSPVSLKHFRVWLKGQYRTLDALNAEWATQFKTWDEVMPLPIRDARARARGKKLPNYAPWADHRRYGDLVYNNYIKHCSDSARAGGDPDAVVGIGGGQHSNPYGGWDYWLVTGHFTWIENYFRITTEYIRSFNTPDRRLKACPGDDVWFSIMHGNRGFYRWVDTGHIRGDFSLLPRGSTTAKQLEEARGGGLAKLFLAATPVDDPIGIHYSQATIRLAYALGSANQYGYGGPLDAKKGFYHLLEEMGRQYKFVSYAQVEAGQLVKGGYKFFILPESAAMSDAEAAALKQFVSAGGVLLIDRDCGGWNERARKREKSLLETHFGIDPAAAATKAIGKGKVVYLNSDLPRRYMKDRNTKAVEPYWKQMSGWLAQAGLAEPRARVYQDGQAARRTEVRYFRLGKTDYYIVRAERPGRYELRLTAPAHLVDIRARRYAGQINTIEVDVDPAFPALVAAGAQRVQAIEASATPAVVEPGKPVKIAAAVKAGEGRRVLNFRVYAPGGEEARHYGDTVLTVGASGELTIPTALNEAKGAWKVKVADLASGVVGEATFEVK